MITVSGLKKTFEEGSGIRYSDLTFETGKTYVMLGASGCGKSTYLNMISGVITPSEGSVVIDGRDMTVLTQKEKDAFRVSNIGYIFQDFRLLEEMSVQDNIDILKLEGVDVSGTDKILDALGILPLKRKKAARLSGGEKQRVAIARAIVKNPEIILADEPTGNLNYEIGRRVMEQLIETSKGKTLICVTHDDRLSTLFDCVLDMNAIACSFEKEAAANA